MTKKQRQRYRKAIDRVVGTAEELDAGWEGLDLPKGKMPEMAEQVWRERLIMELEDLTQAVRHLTAAVDRRGSSFR